MGYICDDFIEFLHLVFYCFIFLLIILVLVFLPLLRIVFLQESNRFHPFTPCVFRLFTSGCWTRILRCCCREKDQKHHQLGDTPSHENSTAGLKTKSLAPREYLNG